MVCRSGRGLLPCPISFLSPSWLLHHRERINRLIVEQNLKVQMRRGHKALAQVAARATPRIPVVGMGRAIANSPFLRDNQRLRFVSRWWMLGPGV